MALEGITRKINIYPDPGAALETIQFNSIADIPTIVARGMFFAKQLGFVERDFHELEIVIRELLTNISRHAGGYGVVKMYSAPIDHHRELIIDFIDFGPGINDSHLVSEGISNGKSLGGGIPAVRRFCDRVELLKNHPRGAIVRIAKSGKQVSHQPIGAFVVVTRPFPGESTNGDQATVIHLGDTTLIALADGLGHGAIAYEASSMAIRIIEQNAGIPLEQLLAILHSELRKTRGAAVSIARIHARSSRIEYLGVGNVLTTLSNGVETRFVNFNGTVGLETPRAKVMEYQVSDGMIFAMFSDGLTSDWLIDCVPKGQYNLYECARTLLGKYARPNDDATLVLGRLALNEL
ncbi:MAG: SpoIIE family protein phosphatase [bacterium]|nr:SpoIIE family protein phosphatase [bacterium]